MIPLEAFVGGKCWAFISRDVLKFTGILTLWSGRAEGHSPCRDGTQNFWFTWICCSRFSEWGMTKRHPRAKAGRSSWVYCLAIPMISRSARTGHLQEIRRGGLSWDLLNWMAQCCQHKCPELCKSGRAKHFYLTLISSKLKFHWIQMHEDFSSLKKNPNHISSFSF